MKDLSWETVYERSGYVNQCLDYEQRTKIAKVEGGTLYLNSTVTHFGYTDKPISASESMVFVPDPKDCKIKENEDGKERMRNHDGVHE